jgi:uncharacterized membrane protein
MENRRMSKYETLLFLHLLSAFLLVAGAGISTSLGIASTKTKSTKLLAGFSGLSAKAEYFVTVPGAIGAIVFGTWLAHYVGYDYGDAWLVSAYILFVIALGIGSGILGRHARRVARKARDLVEQGTTESGELQAEAAAPLIALLGMVEIAIVIAFIYLMVAKPGA